MSEKKNWVERRLDSQYNAPRLWSELLLSIQDALTSYEKRCPGGLKVVSHERINGSSFQAVFQKTGLSGQSILELQFDEDACSITFEWTRGKLGHDGSFSIKTNDCGETMLFQVPVPKV